MSLELLCLAVRDIKNLLSFLTYSAFLLAPHGLGSRFTRGLCSRIGRGQAAARPPLA